MSSPSPRTGYCSSGDLLVGDIPFPTYLTPEQAIAAAADEIDSYLGQMYEIPIDTSAPAAAGVTTLMLKRLNAALASGRAILQFASPHENAQLHKYGQSLVAEALEALKALVNGDYILAGAVQLATDDQPQHAPQINNLDAESSVEAFYDRIANPYWIPPVPVYYPGVGYGTSGFFP